MNRINRKLQSGKHEVDGSVFGALYPKIVNSEIGKPLLEPEPIQLFSVNNRNFKKMMTQNFDETNYF